MDDFVLDISDALAQVRAKLKGEAARLVIIDLDRSASRRDINAWRAKPKPAAKKAPTHMPMMEH